AGRAPPLQGGGHWFDPSNDHHICSKKRKKKLKSVAMFQRKIPTQVGIFFARNSVLQHLLLLS
ncbi:hypothetical protein J4G65_10200, partial [Aeromonas allosaccharophila]|uniref:hypothetical protein n=1 Tax=Aeromonas allosaccharophila TaxID=656 RepID=UPI001BCDBA72